MTQFVVVSHYSAESKIEGLAVNVDSIVYFRKNTRYEYVDGKEVETTCLKLADGTLINAECSVETFIRILSSIDCECHVFE